MEYTNSEIEDFYIRYMAEGMSAGVSMQDYCARHNVTFDQFDRWYRDSRQKNESAQDIYEPLGLTSEEMSQMLILQRRKLDELNRRKREEAERSEKLKTKTAELKARLNELQATQQRLEADMYNMQLAKFLLERHLTEKDRQTAELRKRLADLDKDKEQSRHPCSVSNPKRRKSGRKKS